MRSTSGEGGGEGNGVAPRCGLGWDRTAESWQGCKVAHALAEETLGRVRERGFGCIYMEGKRFLGKRYLWMHFRILAIQCLVGKARHIFS